MEKVNVKLTFIEELLGTANADAKIHEEYIASKAPDAPSREEEIEALGVDGVLEKTMSVFPRDENGNPIIWDYQIKGFFKDACGSLRKVKGTKSSKLTSYKKVIDGLIFPEPRKINISFEGEITSCQRPLRAATMQGERVALANSECIPAGAIIEFSVMCLSDDHMDAVKEWLDYGQLRGLGQWRNSGKGRFTWEEIK